MSKLNVNDFVGYLKECLSNKDGYIMASYGQNPKTGYLIDKPGQTPKAAWQPNGWYYTQYSGAQREKAQYWRENCKRVHDCAGMVEGWIEMQTGTSVNTRARYIYSSWCDPKGSGDIPVAHRVPGAAVFIYSASAGEITHIGYQVEPVVAGKPEGDWWVIEARGVMYGVVKTKLSGRGWNRWGLMTKYFDYDAAAAKTFEYGERVLKKGDTGADVKVLQEKLIAANYSCGTYGTDGDFGSATEEAVKAFQHDKGLEADGIVGEKTYAALDKATEVEDNADPVEPEVKPVESGNIEIASGSWNVRIGPGANYASAGIVRGGDKVNEVKDEGWKPILFNGQVCWISPKAVK